MTTEPATPDSPSEHPEEGVVDRLDTEQYKARLFRYLYILMRLVFFAMIAALLYVVASALGALLVPLLASMLFAYLLVPFIKGFEKRGVSRRLAIIISLSAGVVVLGVIGLFLVPPLVDQIGTIVGKLPALIEKIQEEWIPWVKERFGVTVSSWLQRAFDAEGGGLGLSDLLRRLGAWSLGAASKTSQALFGLFNFLLIPLFAYYFLLRINGAKESLAGVLPVRRRAYTMELLGRMHSTVSDWFRGQIQVAVIVGILYTVGLALAFGSTGIDAKLGIAIGIFSGVVNIIPYFGMIAAIILTSLVVLLNWPGLTGVLGIVSVFVVNHVLEAYVVAPKVLGESVGLHPIAVIILALVGGQLAGIAGILLIVPIAGAIRVVWPDLMAIYRETTFYQGDLPSQEPDSEENS